MSDTQARDGRYRTIVADPPWAYDEGWPAAGGTGTRGQRQRRAAQVAAARNDDRYDVAHRSALGYASMTVDEIAALPVADLAAEDAHLWLWTTNRYLRDSFTVIGVWGFRFSQLLIWAKTPMGKGPGGAFAQNAEFILFCRRGSLPHVEKQDSVWFNWRRTGRHSVKPDAMLDLVERVSPGPYAELFSRRARFGWDYPIGDQALGGVAA